MHVIEAGRVERSHTFDHIHILTSAVPGNDAASVGSDPSDNRRPRTVRALDSETTDGDAGVSRLADHAG